MRVYQSIKIKPHKLGSTYIDMIQRCNNINNCSYNNYGGRGIKVCERWLGKYGFENFVNDMGPKPTSKHSIDRINNDGDYEPSNCRWATVIEQRNNQRKAKQRGSNSNYVYKISARNLYVVSKSIDGKAKHYGYFKKFEDALMKSKELFR